MCLCDYVLRDMTTSIYKRDNGGWCVDVGLKTRGAVRGTADRRRGALTVFYEVGSFLMRPKEGAV